MLDFYKEFKDFKAFEIQFADKNQEEKKLFCSIKSIEDNTILISANNSKNKNVFAENGTGIKVYIYTDSGIYSATSKVLSVEKGTINTEYVIEYPKNSKHSQRREYFRADLNIDFKIKITPKEDSQEEIIIDGKTKNICGKGMSYVYNKPFPEHENIEVELFFLDKNIKTLASFVYSKQIIEGNNPKFINALAFTTIKPKDIDLIVKKCFLHQLEVRKRVKG